MGPVFELESAIGFAAEGQFGLRVDDHGAVSLFGNEFSGGGTAIILTRGRGRLNYFICPMSKTV